MTITGERLKKLRLGRGMSQAEVAKLIGVERVTYLQYEKGINKPVRKLNELANLFNVSTDYLLGNDVKSPLLNEKQTALIKGYDNLNDEGQNMLLGILASLQQSHSRIISQS